MSNFSAQLSEYLLQIKAIQLNVQNPFTWASGWKSPVYCDNRILLSFPEVRNFVKEHLVQQVKTHFPQANCIAGVATAGIPHAALIADTLGLPMIYVRDKPKAHGMQNLIEGKLPQNAKVVVVEDVISTGKSSLKAVMQLREATAHVEGMVGIYSYQFEIAKQKFAEEDVTLYTLTNYSDLIELAVQKGIIQKEFLQTLNDWRKDPANWSPKI